MIALVAVASFAIPCWALLTIAAPLLSLLAHRGVIEPLGSFGPADLQASDLVIIVVALRVLAYILVSRRWVGIPQAVVFFFLVLAGTTALSYFRFGSPVASVQGAALLRFAGEGSVAFLIASSLRSIRVLDQMSRTLRVVGFVIAASIYADVVLFAFGMPFGDVQTTSVGTRYFGPIGDQVGFILPFFIFREVQARRLLPATFLGIPVLATGTRGALASLAVGLVVFWYRRYRQGGTSGREVSAFGLLLAVLGAAFLLDLGAMLTRIINSDQLGLGWDHRTSCFALAFQVFIENPIFGAGFSGFLTRLPSYYAPDFVHATFNQLLRVATDSGVVGIGVFGWMLYSVHRLLSNAIERTSGHPRELLQAGQLWLVSLALGNQTASWLLPGSVIAYLVWLLIGIAAACVKRAQTVAAASHTVARDDAGGEPGFAWRTRPSPASA